MVAYLMHNGPVVSSFLCNTCHNRVAIRAICFESVLTCYRKKKNATYGVTQVSRMKLVIRLNNDVIDKSYRATGFTKTSNCMIHWGLDESFYHL